MAQILFMKEQSIYEKMDISEIEQNDELLSKFHTATGLGSIIEIQEDYFFATPENPNGRGISRGIGRGVMR